MILHTALYCLLVILPVLVTSTLLIGILVRWLRAGYMPGDLILTIPPTVLVVCLTIKLAGRIFPDADPVHTVVLAVASLALGVGIAMYSPSSKDRDKPQL